MSKLGYAAIFIGVGLGISVLVVPYQFMQGIQRGLSGDAINAPIIQRAYGAGSLSDISISPTNNLFKTRSVYEIIFRGSSSGDITSMEFTFPGGFNIANARVIDELSNAGTLSVSGQTLILTLSSPLPSQNVIFRQWFDNIVNGNTVNNQIAITTKVSGTILDGPTLSPAFTLIRVTNSMITDNSISNSKLTSSAVTNSKIANGAITNSKILADSIDSSKIKDGSIMKMDVSNSFIKKIILNDDVQGNAAGWNPYDTWNTANGPAPMNFTIHDSAVLSNSVVLINLNLPDNYVDTFYQTYHKLPEYSCHVSDIRNGYFNLYCTQFTKDGSSLQYVVVN